MANYPISNVSRRIVYTGSAGAGPYAFSFEIIDSTDVDVYKNDTLLTLTTNYTVTINSNGTGSVTLVSAATSSDRITIVGSRAIERTTDFVTGGDLFANTLNEEIDSQTIFVQQVAETAERSIKAPVTDPTNINMTLPSQTSRAGKTLAFDSSGNPVVGEDIGNWRGNWAAATSYGVRDLVKDTTNSNVYRCNTAHVSTGSAPISSNADVAKWDIVIDVTGFVQTAGDTMTGTLVLPNLTFSGTGSRITGDFSNATLGSRVFIQSSTTNGATNLGVIPNGTSTTTRFNLLNSSSTTNYSVGSMLATSSDVRLVSDAGGSGTQLPMTFYTNGSERMRVATTGYVGIGTTSPDLPLDISGSVPYDIFNAGILQNSNTPTSIGQGVALYMASNDGAGTTGSAAIVAINSGSNGAHVLEFRTSPDVIPAVAPIERLRIDENGQVGIGTYSASGGVPQYSLDIYKATSVTLRLQTDSTKSLYLNTSYDSATGNSPSRIYSNGSSRGNLQIAESHNSSGTNSIRSVSYGNNLYIDGITDSWIQPSVTIGGSALRMTAPNGASGEFMFMAAQDPNVSTSIVERMRIDSSGRLLIRTDTAYPAAVISTQTTPIVQVSGSTISTATIGHYGWNTNTYYTFNRSGGAAGTYTAVGTSTVLGLIQFNGTDGTDFIGSSSITGSVDGTVSTGLVTGKITFNTSTSTTSPTEKMRVNSAGNVLVGGTVARGTTVGTAHLDLFDGTAPAGTLTNGVSLYSSSGDLYFMDSAGNGYEVGFRNIPPVGTKTGSYTLTTADVGKYVQVGTGGSITIPNATFAEGDVISVFNNTTGNITITCTITTAYIGGVNTDRATVTLATRGVATILFISGTLCVINGNVS